jgi:indolepyruvate ferredoxin oxidoreductase beta subunit
VSKAPITVLVAALGGEGGGVLAEWLVEAATRAGYPAQGTSIPGVAQRTGATTYYIEIYPERRSELQGREPILGLYPAPGGVDLLVASELLEGARAVLSGFVSPERTTLVTSVSRTLTTHEKIALGDGRFDAAKLLAVAREHSRRLVAFDIDRTARETGTMVSAAMCGAIAATGVLPVPREVFEAVIGESGAGAEASLRGFAAAFSAAQGEGSRLAPLQRPVVAAAPAAAEFPESVQEIVRIGYARLVEFQDQRYAALYLARLRPILAAERASDPAAINRHATTREAARFLALWMAFDDVIRVASLKCRASRFARVRREVGARDGDIVRIVDYLKPGVPELAGLLPPSLARRIVAWDRARQVRGKAPIAFAWHVRTDGVIGFALMRVLAAMRGMRRLGARYAEEQAMIESWLAAVERSTRADWRLGRELALCGRLIKGYGATNERGKRNLSHIIEQLAERTGMSIAARAEAVRQAREAALADDAGMTLDATLVRHGAAPRPIVARPIVWARKPARAPEHRVSS